MKNKTLILFIVISCVMFMGNVKALTEGFDDEIFHGCVLKAASQEESLTAEQLSGIKILNCDGLIASTKGIEKLTNLEELKINVNDEFSGIDLSSNTKLKKLTIYGNGLKEISLTANTLLEELDLSKTSINSLDLQSNVALKKLILSETSLETLNIEKNTELEILNITDSHIEVDLTKNIKLKELYLSEVDLEKYDFSELTSLDKIYASFGYYKVYYINHNEEIDIKEFLKDYIPENIKYDNFDYYNETNGLSNYEEKIKAGDWFNGSVYVNNVKRDDLDFNGNFISVIKANILTFNIKSEKYTIDEINNIIYIGNDKVEDVINNVTYDNGWTTPEYMGSYIDMKVENDELILSQNSSEEELRKFTIKSGEKPVISEINENNSGEKCSEKDGKYYDKNGNSVSKEAYFESCGVVENPKTGIELPLALLIMSVILGIHILLRNKNYFRKI